jgi:threonyl-tRNA synthetase
LGSLERFIGALIEHYRGDLPLWLAPTQALIIPIKDTLKEYAIKVKQLLDNNDIRTDMDNRNETLDRRIRDAELEKVPYILVIGEREAKQETVAVRRRGQGDKGSKKLEEFIREIKEEIEKKRGGG